MKVADHRLTIVNLLKRDLRIVRETLLRFVRQHKCLRFLRGCHLGTMLSIHFRFCESSNLWIVVSRAPETIGLTALGPRSHSYLDEELVSWLLVKQTSKEAGIRTLKQLALKWLSTARDR